MAVELANAYVSIIPSARGMAANLTRELTGPVNAASATAGTKAGKTFGGKFSGALGAIAKGGAALGIAGLAIGVGKVLTDSIDAATESMKVTKDTEAVIKSMGGVANISAGQVANLSLAIAKKTGVDDEAIQTGQNLLLTFGNIRNEVGRGNDIFNQASVTIVDFAARFKTDIPGAARLVGKALNDPIKGLTSLTRVGVQFTESQKAQIKALVESGDLMGAQQIIMGELRRQTEGSAVAQATAAEKMSVAWGNLQEQIGAKLLPAVEAFSTWMTEKGIPFVTILMERLDAAMPVIKRLAPLFVLLVSPLAAVAAGVAYAYNRFTVFRSVVQSVVGWLTGTAFPAIKKFAAGFTETFSGMGEAVTHVFNVIVDVIRVSMAIIVPIVKATLKVIAFAWNTFGQTILGYVQAVWQTIYGIIKGFLQVISGVIKTVLAVINGDWGKAWEGIKQIFQGFATAVRGAVSGFLTFIKALFSNALRVIRDLWSVAWSAVKTAVKTATDAIIGTVTGWKTRLVGIFSGAHKWLFEGGKNIIRGMWTGIKAVWGDVIAWFKDLPGKILDKLGISSPPKWAIDAGKWIMKGVNKGIGWGVGSVLGFMGKFVSKFSSALRGAWDSVYGAVSDVFSAGKDIPGSRGFAGLAEPFASRLAALIAASHGTIGIGSGRRSRAQQAALYAAWVAGVPGQAQAAPPGRSKHERGLAADLVGNKSLAHRLAPIYGLRFPVRGEDWHIELGPGHSYYAKGAWRTGNELATLHAGEMVLPARIAGAVRSALAGSGAGAGPMIGAVNIYANTEAEGRAAAKGFNEVLARRRVVTDARIA